MMRDYLSAVLKYCGLSKSRKYDSCENDNKLRVVLDMDECILCCEDAIGKDSFRLKPGLETVTVFTLGGNSRRLRIHLRPGLRNFLTEISKFADVYIMTAAQATYAIPAIKKIDPESKIFKDIITRERFDFMNGKNLNTLGDRFDLKRTVLVDNLDFNFSYQPSNGILVREFLDDPHDNQLTDVLAILKALQYIADVRDLLKPMRAHNRTFHQFADEIVEQYQLHSEDQF